MRTQFFLRVSPHHPQQQEQPGASTRFCAGNSWQGRGPLPHRTVLRRLHLAAPAKAQQPIAELSQIPVIPVSRLREKADPEKLMRTARELTLFSPDQASGTAGFSAGFSREGAPNRQRPSIHQESHPQTGQGREHFRLRRRCGPLRWERRRRIPWTSSQGLFS